MYFLQNFKNNKILQIVKYRLILQKKKKRSKIKNDIKFKIESNFMFLKCEKFDFL